MLLSQKFCTQNCIAQSYVTLWTVSRKETEPLLHIYGTIKPKVSYWVRLAPPSPTYRGYYCWDCQYSISKPTQTIGSSSEILHSAYTCKFNRSNGLTGHIPL